MAVHVNPTPISEQPTAPRPDVRAAAIFEPDVVGGLQPNRGGRGVRALLVVGAVVVVVIALLATRVLGVGTSGYQLATAVRPATSRRRGMASPRSSRSLRRPWPSR